jgi:hypothetical protein
VKRNPAGAIAFSDHSQRQHRVVQVLQGLSHRGEIVLAGERGMRLFLYPQNLNLWARNSHDELISHCR